MLGLASEPGSYQSVEQTDESGMQEETSGRSEGVCDARPCIVT